MSGIDSIVLPVVDRAEAILDGFGLMTGDYADIKRMVIGYLGAAAIITYTQPSFAYVGTTPRKWRILDPSDKDATYFPWYIASFAGALLMGVFI